MSMRSKKSQRQFWDKLRRETLINSTASSLRLAGVNITNKQVAQIVHQSIAGFTEKTSEKNLSPKQRAVWGYLQNVEEATPGEIARETHVARPTVSQALDALRCLKKIERIGQGRTTRYRKI